jgi:hypothetical protein
MAGRRVGAERPYADAHVAEHAVIDLDDENRQPAGLGTATSERLMARRKMTLRLVAAFAVGVVLGGFGVSELRDSREQRERNAVVALVAVPRRPTWAACPPRDGSS